MTTHQNDAGTRSIAEASLRRLPAYHRLLTKMKAAGIPSVSCAAIARALNLDPTQVRKDIEATGLIGKPKVGHEVASLLLGLEDFLGWNNSKQAFLVGAGSLGSALLGYQRFRQYGVEVIAAFDVDSAKVGQEIHGKYVLPLAKLPDLARRMHIHLGVIATPPDAAQSCADLMVEGGIRAIWNFAPIHLRIPESVILQNEDLSQSLASLSYKLEQRVNAERNAGTRPQRDDSSTAVLDGSEVRGSL
jgi:redox-sensing transcriptional repressor